jgi:hypothetical protein
MLELKSVMVCDAASVREGLLHVLGAGLTVFSRDSYPAPFGADVALQFQVSGELKLDYTVSVVARHTTGDMPPVFEAQLDLVLQGDGALQSIPLALSLHNAGIPAAGLYTLEVVVDGTKVGDLQFIAQMTPTEEVSRHNPFA